MLAMPLSLLFNTSQASILTTALHCRDCAVAASRSEARVQGGRVVALKGGWQGRATGQVTPRRSISSHGRTR